MAMDMRKAFKLLDGRQFKRVCKRKIGTKNNVLSVTMLFKKSRFE